MLSIHPSQLTGDRFNHISGDFFRCMSEFNVKLQYQDQMKEFINLANYSPVPKVKDMVKTMHPNKL